MAPDRRVKDPQDQEFGMQAAADQDEVERLEAEGVRERQMPDSPDKSPRAAGKAEPSGRMASPESDPMPPEREDPRLHVEGEPRRVDGEQVDGEQVDDTRIDQALADTFPSSDPPSGWAGPPT